MKILLLGGSGLLGRYFQDIFSAKNIEFLAPTREDFDVSDVEKIREFFEKNNPKEFSKVVYCVAYTNVEKAETERDECESINREGLKNVLKYKIPVVHFSTDYVFGHMPYGVEIEEDFPRFPLNFYGGTKLRAEKLLESNTTDYWNIRTSWLFGNEGDFISKIRKKSADFLELDLVDDQIGRPTYAKDLAQFVTENFLEKSQLKGSYHFQNTGKPISWAEFAEYVLEKTDWHGSVQKKSADFFGFQAERPRNSVLKNTKLSDNLRSWQAAVDEYLG